MIVAGAEGRHLLVEHELDGAAPLVLCVGLALPVAHFYDKRLAAEIPLEPGAHVLKLLGRLRPGKRAGIQKDDGFPIDPRPLLRRNQAEEIADAGVQPLPAEHGREIDVAGFARGPVRVETQDAGVEEQANAGRLPAFGKQGVVGLDQGRQSRKTPSVILARHAPEHRHQEIDTRIEHVFHLRPVPRRAPVAELGHVRGVGG